MSAMRMVLAIGLCVVGVGRAAAWELDLHVKEMWGQAGPRFVSGGVPLLKGQAKEAGDLRLAVRDKDGRLAAIPAQFRVLARWWRADNSIRWVLVDFQTDVEAGGTKTFCLTNQRLPAPVPRPAVTVVETPETIAVTTGPARFVISKTGLSLFQRAIVDANADGNFADDEDLLDSSGDTGLVLEDTYGQRYYAADGTRSVEVLEAGPLRVRVRARGRNLPRDGKGYSKGLYGYDTFLDFFAGSSDVFADVILTNNPPRSIGSPTFEDASLLLRLKGGATGYVLTGDTPHAGQLAQGQSVCLYQDSNGADTWESCQGYDGDDQDDGWNFPTGVTPSFRGYRLYRRAGGQEEVVAAGDHARGLAHLYSDRGGLVIHTKDFWQQFPKAVEVSSDGTVRLGLFPREQKVPHFLEDTSAKGHEIVLHFYARGRQTRYPLDASGRPDVEAIAGCWDGRVYPRPDLAHIAATGALADLGPFTVPTAGMTKKPDTRVAIGARRMLDTDTLYGNAYGWQIFGERWRSQGGCGRQGARQPMDQDDYLRRWYVTGQREWLAAGEARSRQFRDVRGYRIDDQDPFGFSDWLTFRAANMSENRMDRPQPTDQEYRKYTQGAWKRCGLWLPNPEHMVLDLLYDRYLLFGDVRSFENMRTVAAHGAYFAAFHRPEVTRSQGWGWRALDRYWELTGDKDAERYLKKVIETYKPLIGKPPLISGTPERPNWWFTTIFSRAVAMTALHLGDPDSLALAKTLAVGKEKRARTVSTLYAVLYHLTGEASYKKAVFATGSGEGALSVGGYLFVCDHWLLNQPPRVPPHN